MAEHVLMTGHNIEFQKTKILSTVSNFWDSIIKEAVSIRTAHRGLHNTGTGFHLRKAWDLAIAMLQKTRAQTEEQDIPGGTRTHEDTAATRSLEVRQVVAVVQTTYESEPTRGACAQGPQTQTIYATKLDLNSTSNEEYGSASHQNIVANKR